MKRYISYLVILLLVGACARSYGSPTPPPDLTNWLIKPNGGQTYGIGSVLQVKINGALYTPGPAVVVELYKGATRVWGPTFGGVNGPTIPTTGLAAGTDYRVHIFVYGTSPLEEDWSNSYFTLVVGGPISGPCTEPTVVNGLGCPVGVQVQLLASSSSSGGENICGHTVSHKWYTTATGSTFVAPTIHNTGTCALYNTSRDVSTVTTYWVSAIIDGCESPRVPVSSVYSNQVPTLAVTPTLSLNGSIYSGAVFCAPNGIGNPTLTASGGGPSSQYTWYAAATGGGPIASGAVFSPTLNYSETTNGIKTYYAHGILTNDIGCTFSLPTRMPVSVKLLNYSTTVNAGPDREFFSNDSPFQLTPSSSGNNWAGNGTSPTQPGYFLPALAGPGVHSVSLSFTSSYSDTYTQCTTPPDVAMFTVYDGPGIGIIGNEFISKSNPVTLVATGGTYTTYQWYDPEGIVAGATGTTYVTSKIGIHSLRVTKGSISKTVSRDVKGAIGTGVNYITTYSPTKAGFKNDYLLPISTVEDVTENTGFFDDLGRPIQSVATQNSPGHLDMVSPIGYDDFGREAKKYLPYASGTNGTFKANALKDPNTSATTEQDKYRSGAQYGFYQGGSKLANDQYPYSETKFDRSPLNRVIEQSAPGLVWLADGTDSYTSTDKTVKKAYEWNVANEVMMFDHVPSNATYPQGSIKIGKRAYYGPNELRKNRTKDEQGNEVIEYADKENHVILKKVQADATTYAQTYYVYDNFNNLVHVLQPEGAAGLVTKLSVTWANTANVSVGPSDNSLAKSGTAGYSGKATSTSATETLAAGTDGWVEMVANEVNTSRMIGLSNSVNTTATNIQFAVELRNDGSIYVWENGVQVGTTLGTYASGTVVKVSREGTQVKYYVDGIWIRTSSVSSSGTLMVNAALNDLATIKDVSISFKIDAALPGSLSSFAFKYVYDLRNRVTQKQVPGAGVVFTVYDYRDRVVLTQDAVQRAASLWSFTKYDAFNRPVLTGSYTSSNTLSAMQYAVDTYYSTLTGSQAWFESFVGASGPVHGYDNKSFPQVTNTNDYRTVTYYDNYLFRTDWAGTWTYLNEGLSQVENLVTNSQPVTENLSVIGQVTGTKVKVLDGGATGGPIWLKSISYFDAKYRLVQTLSDNYKRGTDRVTNVVNFNGAILKTKTTHIENDIQWKDLAGVAQVGGGLVGTSGNQYAMGAVSAQQLAAGVNGWAEFTVTETNLQKVIGFNDSNPDAGNVNIDYYFFLYNSTLYIYENNVLKNSPAGTLTPGDILRLERIGTSITYRKNGVLLYTSTVPSSSLLMVDCSIQLIGATIAPVRTSFSTSTHTITKSFEYDHAGRLVKTWHQIDALPVILLAKNEYNEIGQLVDKKLHSTNGSGTDAKQSVDYRYNIRGWLTKINESNIDVGTADPSNSGEARDFFGMELGYSSDIGPGNASLFNGNIGAVKWSKNQGLGTVKENSYSYSYDPMNRIKGATLKEKGASWNLVTNSAFSESNYNYDLNGNIKSLIRYDQRGSSTVMDNLVYDYGTAGTNQLQKVSDSGDKFAGFIDGTNSGNDYTYDANGNMITDQNKGITTVITYNYLNLPEVVTRGGAGGNYVRYIYDALGRKLSQTVNFSGGRKVTDYAGEFIYENDVLQFVNQEEGRIVMSSVKSNYLSDASATTNFTAASSTVTAITQNTSTYVKAVANGTVARTGLFPIGGNFPVVAGERYKIRARGYRDKGTAVSSSTAYLLIQVNGADQGWPGAALPVSLTTGQTEMWIEQEVTIPTGGTTMQAGIVWNTVLSGEAMFINDFEVVQLTTSAPDYQYHLKDHLGNVRTTFTTTPVSEQYTATYEDVNIVAEQSKFLRYTNARRVISYLFDHTNGSAPSIVSGDAQRLVGGGNEIYGLARSVSVMPGDVIQAQVYAKYVDTNPANRTAALNNLLVQIAVPNASVVVDGSAYGLSTSSFPFTGLLNTSGSSGGPKAYLNWLIFDRNYLLVDGGYVRLSATPKETGADVAHELLTSGDLTIKQPGYVYIYLSNEETSPVEVYFDDFRVTQTKSPVVQQDDYFPFGLKFNSYTRENGLTNKIRIFQGQEHIDDLGLDWDYYKYRNHHPDIGRFFNVDLMAEAFYYNSPYSFSENKVTAHREMEGLEAFFIHGTSADNSMWKKDMANFIMRELKPYFNTNQTADMGFKWDGYKGGGMQRNWLNNTENDRAVAARTLVSYILKNRKAGQSITLVGHSHGGNVAIQAARILFEKHNTRVNIVNFNTPAWNGADDPENPWNNFGIDEMLHFFTDGDNIAGPISGSSKYEGLIGSNITQIELKNPLRKDLIGFSQHYFENTNWEEVLIQFLAMMNNQSNTNWENNQEENKEEVRPDNTRGF